MALRIAFAGGGTGGHLYPARNLLNVFEKKTTCEAVFFGTPRGIEARKVPEWGYPLHLLPVRGFKRGLAAENLLFPWYLWQSLRSSRRILKRFDPHLVIGTGGYVMGPVVREAVRLGFLTVLQEQNSYPGVTTRWLAARVRRVYGAYPETCEALKKAGDCRVYANPVVLARPLPPQAEARETLGLEADRQTVLIFGGSLGAQSINRAVYAWLGKGLPEDVQVIWQTGRTDYARYSGQYAAQKNIRVTAFIEDMARAYAAADFAICRAGAMSLAELGVAGVPAIVVPYPHAAADHQMKNARVLEKRGAVQVIPDDDALTGTLEAAVTNWLMNPQIVKEHARNMLQTGDPEAAEHMVDEILRLLEEKGIWNG
ncbi:MAG: undecaprenyldiphospho-muramoylpentapeptide beta-N-acetylglucosaminyltransferase [Calditrichaeota bacterium]|nr:MAG: undecaprenyldiphospho-muramoylpentapeptide beta-N-acetylglucosaminyltransferase [Calditrichota bacterium]